MYVADYGRDKGVVWALNEGEAYDYNPFAMWHFIPVEDEDYPMAFYLQNLGSGLYVGDYPTYSQPVLTTDKPQLYVFNITGGEIGFIARRGENPGYSLHAANSGNTIVGWSAGAGTASSWAVNEVDPNIIDAITIPAKTNNIDVFSVPYDFADISVLNEDVKAYGIRKMTLDAETDITTIELYEKESFEAGEPCVLVTGDPTVEESEDMTLVLAMPTEIATSPIPANGLVGLWTTDPVPANTAWFTGKEITLRDEPVHISAHTGYIDPQYYTGEVTDAETALTLTIKGLKWPEASSAGDVDGDGKVNTSDVVAVYSYIIDGDDSGIAKAAADVDGDGNVTTADVVAIYDIIINGVTDASHSKSGIAGSGSNGFYPTDEGQAEMSAFVGSSDDLTKVPVTITLAIPEGKEITAFEASLEIFAAPEGVVADESVEGSVQKFLFNGRRAVVEDTDRWTEDHSGTYSKGTKEHGANSMFISIVNQYLDPFTGSEGPIITVFFDASELAEGDYVVRAFDLLAVGTDKSSQTSPDVDAKFTVKDGKVTAVTAITGVTDASFSKSSYSLDGKKVAAPQKGQIYVVDGKTVKF